MTGSIFKLGRCLPCPIAGILPRHLAAVAAGRQHNSSGTVKKILQNETSSISFRSLSHHPPEGKKEEFASSEEILLLKARFILPIRLVMRVKHANLALCAGLIFDYFMLTDTSAMPTSLWLSAAAMVAATGAMAVFASKIVLRLSYLPAEGLIRVSSLSVLCRRQDYLIRANSIVPFGDNTNQSPFSLLHRLEVLRSKQRRYYCLRYSDIPDPSLLADLLWLPPELGGDVDRSWKRAQDLADAKAEEEAQRKTSRR